ncbi:MAG: ABC transporter substrate-binding protein [Proteobacteria bacterium]|nr:ABC transporter substrate-binding protein [Pseudomonadota bacterium]
MYAQGHGNFAAITSALAVADADLFVMAGDLWDSMAAVRAAKAQGFMPYGFAFSVGPSVPFFATAMGLGGDANHLIGATQWSPAAQLQGSDRYGTSEAFSSAFWDAYNARPSYLSAGAYATGLTYENAIRRAGTLDASSVRAALAATDYETFYGRIRFNENGLNETKPIYTIQLVVEGSKVQERLLWPLNAAGVNPIWPFPGWNSVARLR